MHPVVYRAFAYFSRDPYSNFVLNGMGIARDNIIAPTLDQDYLSGCAVSLWVWIGFLMFMYWHMLRKPPPAPEWNPKPTPHGSAEPPPDGSANNHVEEMKAHTEAMNIWTNIVMSNIMVNLVIFYQFCKYHNAEMAVCLSNKFWFWLNSASDGTFLTNLVYGVKNYGAISQEELALALSFGLVVMVYSWVKVGVLFMDNHKHALCELVAWWVLGFVYTVLMVYYYRNAFVVVVAWMFKWWDTAKIFYSTSIQNSDKLFKMMSELWNVLQQHYQKQI